MARKTLLTEAEIRSFMKLANLTPVGDARLQEWQPTLDEEEAFIDVPRSGAAAEEEPANPEREEFGIEGANITGRNMAYETFKQVEKQILDSYDLLEDPEDRDIFYDYLITNLKLYFDKFEDELAPSVKEPTTNQYEKETSSMKANQL